MRHQLGPAGKDLTIIGSVFERTFQALNSALGEDALRKFDLMRGKFSGPFLISAFELIALGVSYNIDLVEAQGSVWLRSKIMGAWSDRRSEGIYGQGVSTARRLPKTLALGRKYFSEV